MPQAKKMAIDEKMKLLIQKVHETGAKSETTDPNTGTRVALEVRNGCKKDQLGEKLKRAQRDGVPLLYEIAWFSVSRGSASPDDVIQLLTSELESFAGLPELLSVYVPSDRATSESARLDAAYKPIAWPPKFPPASALSKETTLTGHVIYEFELRNDKSGEVAKVLIEGAPMRGQLRLLWMDIFLPPKND